jgi:hypothetical protein
MKDTTMPGFYMSNTNKHGKPVSPSSPTCNIVANALSTTKTNQEIPEMPGKAVEEKTANVAAAKKAAEETASKEAATRKTAQKKAPLDTVQEDTDHDPEKNAGEAKEAVKKKAKDKAIHRDEKATKKKPRNS